MDTIVTIYGRFNSDNVITQLNKYDAFSVDGYYPWMLVLTFYLPSLAFVKFLNDSSYIMAH